MSNIVQFPNIKKATPPQNVKELEASVQEVRARFATEVAVELAFDVFRNMEKAGLDINHNDGSRYDLLLITDSIKSAMFRSLNIKHPLQDFAQDVVEHKGVNTDFNMPVAEE